MWLKDDFIDFVIIFNGSGQVTVTELNIQVQRNRNYF